MNQTLQLNTVHQDSAMYIKPMVKEAAIKDYLNQTLSEC